MRKYDRVLALFLKHLDVLALLLFVGNIVDGLARRLLTVFIIAVLFRCRILLIINNFGFDFFSVFIRCTALGLSVYRLNLKALGKGNILALKVLEEDVIRHLLAELVILQAAELDERTDIVPVLLVLFLLGLAHSGQLVCNLLADII